MSEGIELNLQEPVMAKKIEKPSSPEAPVPRMYNLLKKVEGMSRQIEASPKIHSDRVLEKRLRRLGNKHDALTKSIAAHEAEYADKYGKDAVQGAKQNLEQLSTRMRKIEGRRAVAIRDKVISELESMGYGK